jgi:hypothetical protein
MSLPSPVTEPNASAAVVPLAEAMAPLVALESVSVLGLAALFVPALPFALPFAVGLPRVARIALPAPVAAASPA